MSSPGSARSVRQTDLERAVDAVRSALSSGVAQIHGQVVDNAESLYRALDSDGRGMLEREEILAGLTELDLGLEDELTQFVESMEVNAEQCIEVGAFLQAMNLDTAQKTPNPLFQHPRKARMSCNRNSSRNVEALSEDRFDISGVQAISCNSL